MTAIAFYGFATYGINLLLSAVVFGLALFALLEALRAPASAYDWSFKRTKSFWLAVTGAAALFSGMMLMQAFFFGGSSIFLQLIAATAAGVFLADVRPAVRRS